MCTKERKEQVYKELRDTIDDLVLLEGRYMVESKLGILILEKTLRNSLSPARVLDLPEVNNKT